MAHNDEVSGWPRMPNKSLRVASPLDWLVSMEIVMNILEETAVWKPHTEKPDESGNYLTFTAKEGLHQWGFDKDHDHWGNGLYTPGVKFKWLNVKIDMLSGINWEC